MALVVKNPPVSLGVIRDIYSITESGRSLGGGQGNLLHYSCLENPMDRGACPAIVHRVAKSWTWLRLNIQAHGFLTGRSYFYAHTGAGNTEAWGVTELPKAVQSLCSTSRTRSWAVIIQLTPDLTPDNVLSKTADH